MTEKELQEAARLTCNEYAREWRRRNPEKVRERNRRYWEKKARQKIEQKSATKEDL